MQKTQKTQMSVFVQISKKREMKIFLFCVIAFEPVITKTCEAPPNDHQNLSFVKDPMNTHMMKKWPGKVVQRPFINSVSFRNSLYISNAHLSNAFLFYHRLLQRNHKRSPKITLPCLYGKGRKS